MNEAMSTGKKKMGDGLIGNGDTEK
jgi:hypothetical protein